MPSERDADDGRQVRGKRLRQRVLDATIEAIELEGIDNVRVSCIAARAGVHETSVYRNWKTLPKLLIDALMSRTETSVPPPDTGSLDGDLRMFAESLTEFSSTETGRAFNRGIARLGDDEDIRDASTTFWRQRLSSMKPIIERGKERGEVRPDVDSDTVIVLIGGFVTFHSLFLEPKLSNAKLGQMLNVLQAGLR